MSYGEGPPLALCIWESGLDNTNKFIGGHCVNWVHAGRQMGSRPTWAQRGGVSDASGSAACHRARSHTGACR